MFSLVYLPNYAQTPKGLIVNSTTSSPPGKSRAVVIGISKYQQIDSLQFADRDAEEFASFLSGNAWSIPKENILLLTNQHARTGDILSALSWLTDSSRMGDKVVFYFSGHGDVETIADSSKGFLLAYDSPRNNYATGAISITVLQSAFNLLIGKGVKLFLVTDACRSGHLAGGAQGIEQTAKAFSTQWRNETKVLSAQPDELSYEGKQWGDGRGVFSFFLLKGLNGYADVNKDSTITLAELEQYVGLQVAEETKFKQQPVFEGPNKFSSQVARTDTSGMARYSQWKTGSEVSVLVINKKNEPATKGRMEGDSSTNCRFYDQLIRLLDKELIDSGGWTIIKQIYDSVRLCPDGRDKSKSRYLLSAALMNDVQQTVNQTLLGQRLVDANELDIALGKIEWIQDVNKQSALIYADHLSNLKSYLLINKLSQFYPDQRRNYAKEYQLTSLLEEAIAREPTASYLLNAKGILFFYAEKNQEDSALYYFNKAITYSPTWLIPKLLSGHVYQTLGQKDSAIYWYEQILRMDTAFQTFECAVCFFQELGDLYNETERFKEAEIIYKKALSLDPDNVRCIYGLIETYIDVGEKKQVYFWLNQMEGFDSTAVEKLETLELVIENKLWSKGHVERRLEEIKKLLAPDDSGLSQGLFRYTMGLFKDNYNTGSGVNDFGYAVEVTQELPEKEHIKFRLGYIKSRLTNLKLVDAGGSLDEYIDFIRTRYSLVLTKPDLYDLDYYEGMYLLISGTDEEKGVGMIRDLLKKKIIDCVTLQGIHELLRRLEKYSKKYAYPESLKALRQECNQ